MQQRDQAGPEVLWRPRPDVRERSEVGRFLRRVESRQAHGFSTYEELWKWSVTDLSGFWSSVRDHFATWPDDGGPALTDATMPGAIWFPEARLNYAQRALQLSGRGEDEVVVLARSQTRAALDLSVRDLRDQVARARAGLRRSGVGPGDRVAAYLPNIPECLVAFLATASLGATWSSCPPEFGSQAVIDRLVQFEPTVLITADGYRYGKKVVSRLAETEAIRAALPLVQTVVIVPYLEATPEQLPGSISWGDLTNEWEPLAFEPVPFDHPLYVLYTSGTTGLPKPIVHGHGGMLLEHAKALALHTDLGSADRFFWYTTTGWMMWNYLVSGLIVDSSIVLFDGHPGYPDLGALWRLADEAGVTYFGVSAPYLMRCRSEGLRPAVAADLAAIRGVGTTGAPLPASGFRWVYSEVGSDVHLGSLSGGTDVCTGFVGPSPLVPVWAGEISCRMLGARVEAFDSEGRSVVGEQGELVLTAPLPSMPVRLLDDSDGARYRETYFSRYENAWAHGDWVTISERGSCVISGRSDATLNQGGVRIGTGEFYAVIEDLAQVIDSLVIHLEDPDDGIGVLAMFVVLGSSTTNLDEMLDLIRSTAREQLSPRHVPDVILPVRALPRTLSGKRLEVPIKRILSGTPQAEAVALATLDDPDALLEVIDLAREQGLAR